MTSLAAALPVRVRDRVDPQRTAAAALGLLPAPVLAANGGYYPTSWGWSAMALAWATVLVAALSSLGRPTVPELAFIGGLTAFGLWIAVSTAWTSSSSSSVLELERTLVYVSAALAVVTLVRRRHVPTLVGATLAGTTLVCAYALSTRLFPRATAVVALAGYRLAAPVGYWNGLGLLAGIGTVLALIVAARARGRSAQALSAGAIPILVSTLYFTFSRGAWLSLLAGLVVLLAADRRRLQLVGVGVVAGGIAGLVVLQASREDALTTTTASVASAATEGHRLALVVGGAAVVSACAVVLVRSIERFWLEPRLARIAAGALVLAVAVAGAAVLMARFGSPASIAKRSYHSFLVGGGPGGTNLSHRVFSLANNGRLAEWRVALHAFEAHPVAGIGAGGYENYWNQHRTLADLKVRDAHNLYMETLAEDGVVGMAFLAVALLAPFAAFVRARKREPLAAGALAAFTTFLVAAAADWHWELSGVTLVALLCGGAVLAAGRRDRKPARRWRLLPLVLGAVVALAALVGLGGNLQISSTAAALGSGNLAQAAADARSAQSWAPWSSAPWEQLGEAQLDLGQLARAEKSFRNAISRDPNSELLWIDLARASFGRAQAGAFARARKLNPLDSTPAVLESQLGGRPAFSGGKRR